MEKTMDKMMKYFAKHQSFNAYVHIAGGIGIGFLLTYPVAREHPVRWGLSFLALAVLGHIYAATAKK